MARLNFDDLQNIGQFHQLWEFVIPCEEVVRQMEVADVLIYQSLFVFLKGHDSTDLRSVAVEIDLKSLEWGILIQLDRGVVGWRPND